MLRILSGQEEQIIMDSRFLQAVRSRQARPGGAQTLQSPPYRPPLKVHFLLWCHEEPLMNQPIEPGRAVHRL